MADAIRASLANKAFTTMKAWSSEGRDACSRGEKWWKTTRCGSAKTRTKRLRRSAMKILVLKHWDLLGWVGLGDWTLLDWVRFLRKKTLEALDFISKGFLQGFPSIMGVALN